MYSWNYDPNYVTVTMGTTREETRKHKVRFPSKYEAVVFTPSHEEDREAMELAYALSLPRSRVDSTDEGSVDLRHTTHSLKRHLRARWCKKALVGLVVALFVAAAVTAALIIGKESSLAQGVNTTVPTTTFYRECTSTQFTCLPGECIPDRWRCDGRVDCSNEADEKNCDNFTATPPRSCKAWKDEFQIKCPPSGCPFYPTCTRTGHWDPVQCTVDNASCWCVDRATGATVPGSFVRHTAKDGRPFCEMRPV